MAQQDAMEQVKEVLRQVIRYRFWISVSIAALFAVIAYFMGSGPVKAAADKQRNDIKAAESGVKKFATGNPPTPAYKPIVEEKTEVVTKDVNRAWKELYDRQAPLLTWPETVQDRFRKWGRKWPEGEDSTRVRLAFVDYSYAYPAYVDMVYKTFDPFNYETGKGIVAAPTKEALLRPATFSDEDKPDLGKVWSAQERLWIQHTVLEVVAQVNKKANAKDWDSAIIKEIEVLEVGNPTAQDQRSLAKSEELKKSEPILAPGETVPEEGGDAAAASPMMAAMGGMGGKGREGMMGMMMGARRGMGGAGGGGGAGAQYDETIYYIAPPNDKGQYKILPVLMTVLIDQDHVQDFLVELENSPMAIQVKDFELARPSSRVTKPEKGQTQAGGMMGGMMGGMGGYGGMMRMMMGGGRQSGYGGMMSQMNSQMRMMMGGGRGGMGGYGGMMGMGGAAKPERKGTDVRNVDQKKKREEAAKASEQNKGPALFDPYFDIVEVTVYGQARFYIAPPSEPAAEPSLGDTPAAATPPAAAPGTAAGAEEKSPAAQPGDASKAAGAPASGPDASKKAAGAPTDETPPAKADAEKSAAKPAEAAKPAGNGAVPKK